MKKVLVFEDDTTVVDLYEVAIRGRMQVIRILTFDEAIGHLAKPDEIAAIIIGGNQQRNALTGARTVFRLRTVFRGPIIATSSYPDVNDELMVAGCSHSAPKPGSLLPVMEILDLPLTPAEDAGV